MSDEKVINPDPSCLSISEIAEIFEKETGFTIDPKNIVKIPAANHKSSIYAAQVGQYSETTILLWPLHSMRGYQIVQHNWLD